MGACIASELRPMVATVTSVPTNVRHDRARFDSIHNSATTDNCFLHYMPPLLMLIITFPLQRDSGARAARNFRFFSSLAFLLRSGYKPLTVLALGITREDRRLLDQFSDDYADKWFEYPDRFWRRDPKFEQLRAPAHRVCDTIRVYGRKKRTIAPVNQQRRGLRKILQPLTRCCDSRLR